MHIVHCIPRVIPPPAYGGIERLVFWLIREQVRRGLRVSVMTIDRSTVGDVLPGVCVISFPELREPGRIPDPEEWDYRDLIPADADVAHFHSIPPPGALPEIPFIVTEQNLRKVSRRFRGFSPNMVFVSRSHAENHGAHTYVYSGVPLEEYPLVATKDDYMLFMAALGWRVKNPKTAIHLAFDTGMPLKLAGGELRGNRKLRGAWMLRAPFYPALLEVLGNVGGDAKLGALQRARLLYYLVGWEEPFALAPHEALACGTPVLATPHGALAEYIRDGQNGYLVRRYRDALEKLERLRGMSPDETAAMANRCRESAFRIEDCADGYMELYERVIRDRWLYPPEQAHRIRVRGLNPHRLRWGRRRIRRYPFKLG